MGGNLGMDYVQGNLYPNPNSSLYMPGTCLKPQVVQRAGFNAVGGNNFGMGNVDFKTYKHEAAIQSGWHDSTRFDASFASRLALILDLDQEIQFVEVQLASVHFD